MAYHYDRCTVLEPAGENCFTHVFHPAYLNESGGPLGSMIKAIALKAILAVLKPQGYPHPLSLYSNFFASPQGGQKCEIKVEIQKKGRSICFAEAKLYIPSKKQPGTMDVAFCAQGSFGTLTDRPPIFSRKPLAVPYYKLQPYPTGTAKPPSECMNVYDLIPEDLYGPFNDNLHMLVDKDAVTDVLKTTQAKMAAGFADDMMDASYGDLWIGDRDSRPVDYEALVIYSDVLPSFNTRMQTAYSKYAPSVMSTVCEAMHFLAPIPDDNGPFVRARATLTIANADLAEYEAVLWGRSGQPLAVARQIGLLRDMAGAPEGSVAAELAKKAKL